MRALYRLAEVEQEQGTGSQEWPFALVNTSIPGAVDAVDGVDAVDAVDIVAAVVRGVVAPKQQLQYTIYSSTAVQQYSSTTETAVQQPFTPHTPSGGRRILMGFYFLESSVSLGATW